jgi:hypothetical protein
MTEPKISKRPYQGNYRADLHLNEQEETSTPPNTAPDNTGNPQDAGHANPLTPEEETYAQRYANLRRKEAKQRQEYEAELARIKEENERLRSNSPFAIPKTPEELEAWAKEYPDVAGVISTVAEKKAREIYSGLAGKLEEVERTKEEVLKDKAYLELKKLHPDIDDIHADQNFHRWAQEQEPEIQDWLFEGYNWKLAAKAIQMYKDETGAGKRRGPGRPRKDEQDDALAASMAVGRTQSVEPPNSNGRRIFKESEVAKMSDHEFEQYEEEIDAQIRSGIFINDLPKKNYA